jgi:hypothetical protein
VVPPDSQQIPRARCYLGSPPGDTGFSRTGVSPSALALSRRVPLTTVLSHSPPGRQTGLVGPTTPHTQPLPGIPRMRFSLFRFRSPLLTESRLFSLPAGTEMFHFPAFPPRALCVQTRVTPHDWGRVSPFGHPWISARLAAPQGLSQPPTSFIGSWCQGIHRVPLKTCTTKMLASTVQFSKNERTPPLNGPRLPTGNPANGSDDHDGPITERHRSVFSQDPTAYRQTPQPLHDPSPLPEGSSTDSRNNHQACISQHPQLMSNHRTIVRRSRGPP